MTLGQVMEQHGDASILCGRVLQIDCTSRWRRASPERSSWTSTQRVYKCELHNRIATELSYCVKNLCRSATELSRMGATPRNSATLPLDRVAKYERVCAGELYNTVAIRLRARAGVKLKGLCGLKQFRMFVDQNSARTHCGVSNGCGLFCIKLKWNPLCGTQI